MLSILIPTYNFDITYLVKETHKQCRESNIEFEILVYDDGSRSSLNITNSTIKSLDFCIFKELPKNIGRSAIRNLLAKDAKFKNLLFIDAGTFPKYTNFIKKYLSIKNQNVICGGMTHLENPPKKPYKLRWLYTKKREYKHLCSSNFMIDKNIFLSNSFDESLIKYGYEDVLFFKNISNRNIEILFFDNPVIHNADDNAHTFIRKTENSIENLNELIEKNRLNPNGQKIYKLYRYIKKFKLSFITYKIFNFFRPYLLKNFNSTYPSLLLFDIYRIGYYCLLKTKK